MPRMPTTLSIVPSRLAVVLHLALAAAVLGVILVYAPTWLALAGLVALGGALWCSLAGLPRGLLRAAPLETGGLAWSWRPAGTSDWRRVAVRCDYLGPWLIGLRLEGRRLWLWPDSAEPDALRALRRLLVAPP
jgi:toxin CptA